MTARSPMAEGGQLSMTIACYTLRRQNVIDRGNRKSVDLKRIMVSYSVSRACAQIVIIELLLFIIYYYFMIDVLLCLQWILVALESLLKGLAATQTTTKATKDPWETTSSTIVTLRFRTGAER